MQSSAHELYQNGVVVIKLLDQEELERYHQGFWNETRQFPEYLTQDEPIYVMGAFGALGNPGSFHNMTVRNLRKEAMQKLFPLFQELDQSNRYLQQLIDRMSIRRQGTTPTKETWHRDQSPIVEGDDIFGGWINLDLKDNQYFSCLPETHRNIKEIVGFDKIDADAIKPFLKYKKLYQIPPGHCVIFYQNIIHEVLAKKAKITSIRLYLGWRLTYLPQPLFKYDYDKQAICKLPSGQLPPMYAQMHLCFNKNKLISWSTDTFKPICLTSVNLVDRFMKSLADYNFPLYPTYDQEELNNLTGIKL